MKSDVQVGLRVLAVALVFSSVVAVGKDREELRAKLRPQSCFSSLDEIVAGDTTVTGHVPPGTDPDEVVITIKSGSSRRLNGEVTNLGSDGAFEFAPAVPGELVKDAVVTVQTPQSRQSRPVTVSAAPEPSPLHVSRLSKDDQVVSGEIGESARDAVVEAVVSDSDGKFRTRSRTVADADGTFVMGLTSGLNCGDQLRFQQGNTDLGTLTVHCPKPTPPRFYPVREGELSVSGQAGDAESVVVEVVEPSKRKQSGEGDMDQLIARRTAKVNEQGDFSVTVEPRLAVGQLVTVTGLAGGAPTGVAQSLVQPVDFDWGRVRAYFTTGVLFSQSDGSATDNNNFFSRPDYFVGFNLDKNWWMSGGEKGTGKVRLHSFFDTRLSAIPVTDVKTTTDGGNGSGGQTAQTPFNSLDTFKNSRKAAIMQVGVYMPIITTGWRFRGVRQSLFVAPLSKVGVITPTDDRNIDPHFNRFYTLFGHGFRFGHFQEYEVIEPCKPGRDVDRNHSPELVSYLDVVFGKYGNFESVQDAPKGEEATFQGARRRPWRVSFEGVLKIPSTPLIVGFNANLGTPWSSKPGWGMVHDDLRLLFGTRFDVGKLFARLGTF